MASRSPEAAYRAALEAQLKLTPNEAEMTVHLHPAAFDSKARSTADAIQRKEIITRIIIARDAIKTALLEAGGRPTSPVSEGYIRLLRNKNSGAWLVGMPIKPFPNYLPSGREVIDPRRSTTYIVPFVKADGQEITLSRPKAIRPRKPGT